MSESRVAVVTDSTSYLPPELAAEHGVEVVALQVVIGGTAYDERSTGSTLRSPRKTWRNLPVIPAQR